MSTLFVIVFAGFNLFLFATLLLTGWLRNQSIKNQWFDWPTDRGSHADPVPNIGGLAMSLVLFIAIVLLSLSEQFSFSQSFLWLFILLMLSLVGFIDDLRDLSTGLRLAVHVFVAAVVVKVLGGVNEIDAGIINVGLSKLSFVLGMLWVVGFINMYNFMDGINGLAGCQALIAAVSLAAWMYYFGYSELALFFIAVAAVSVGFLYWNFTPAKVFMGDSGSTMLGGLFAAAGLKLHNDAGVSIVFPALLFVWFLADTSFTLIKRLLNREKFWQAHRQHLYQKLTPTQDYHTKVTGMISLLTLIISLIITMVLFKHADV